MSTGCKLVKMDRDIYPHRSHRGISGVFKLSHQKSPAARINCAADSRQEAFAAFVAFNWYSVIVYVVTYCTMPHLSHAVRS